MFKGLTRGVDLIAQFFVLFVWAVKKNNAAAISDCLDIASTWYKETTGVEITAVGALNKKSNLDYFLFLGNYDPWAGSRMKFQVIAHKYIII